MLSKIVLWVVAWLVLAFIGACVGIVLPWEWATLLTGIYVVAEISLALICIEFWRQGRALVSVPSFVLRCAPFVAAWIVEYLKYNSWLV